MAWPDVVLLQVLVSCSDVEAATGYTGLWSQQLLLPAPEGSGRWCGFLGILRRERSGKWGLTRGSDVPARLTLLDALIPFEHRKPRFRGVGIRRGQRGPLKHTREAHLTALVPGMPVGRHVWNCFCLGSQYFVLTNWPKNCKTGLASALSCCYFLIS